MLSSSGMIVVYVSLPNSFMERPKHILGSVAAFYSSTQEAAFSLIRVYFPVISATSVASTGSQPSLFRVNAFDVGLSIETNGASHPKCSVAASREILDTGRFRRRPIASAMFLKGIPSSPAPCKHEPAGADSTANRNKFAASSRCMAGQRFDPSPTYAETPFSRARPARRVAKP